MAYGCWGQLGNADLPGYGAPMDIIDAAYREWHFCRTCAGIDDSGCSADNTPYELDLDPESQRVTCGSAQNSLCARHICSCDEHLAHLLAKNWKSIDSTLYLSQGFDHTVKCVKSESSGGSSKSCLASSGTAEPECCGEYPNRFPYNSRGGCFECCNTKTYNVYERECCANGDVRKLGQCD